jgi:hypothetical protein
VGRTNKQIVRIAILPASAKKALNLFFPPQTQSQGDLSPVYSRADLSRTMTLVVALLLTVVSTGAFARGSRAANTEGEADQSAEALRQMGALVAERSGGRLQMRAFHSRQFGEGTKTLKQNHAGIFDLNRTNVALIGTMVPSNVMVEAAVGGIYIRSQRDPQIAQLIERIREVK